MRTFQIIPNFESQVLFKGKLSEDFQIAIKDADIAKVICENNMIELLEI